jgi:2-polyprenyl-3-methyl-5-hydroxy-6-metoxy-1,4-benzoquinol methylase
MSDELTRWYEEYKSVHGDAGYCMEKMKDTSRVKFLTQYIRKLVPKGGKILDVGCGDMYLSTILPEYEWVGIDIAPDVSNMKAIKQDLMVPPYPFPDKTFDAVVCSEVLEHVWDLRVVNAEVKRLLKPNGVYLMSTPNFDHIDHTLSGYRELLFNPVYTHQFEHIRQYNYDVHKKLLEEEGFKIEESIGADAHFTKFFAEPRKILYVFLNEQLKLNLDLGQVDQVLGACFPKVSHTIIFVSRA